MDPAHGDRKTQPCEAQDAAPKTRNHPGGRLDKLMRGCSVPKLGAEVGFQWVNALLFQGTRQGQRRSPQKLGTKSVLTATEELRQVNAKYVKPYRILGGLWRELSASVVASRGTHSIMIATYLTGCSIPALPTTTPADPKPFNHEAVI